MAGDWIKMEISTPDKPEVFKMARLLGVDRDSVVGKLFRFWAWMDRVSVDGRVDGVASTDVDAVVGTEGFSDALISVGWLEEVRDTSGEVALKIPNFDRHSGESGKKRALKNKRQARWRQGLDVVDGGASTKASTREEKRREDNITPPLSPPRGRNGTRIDVESLPEEWHQWCLDQTPMVDPPATFDEFRDFWIAAAGQKGVKRDWFATWRNWCRREQEKGEERKSREARYGRQEYPLRRNG